MKAFWSALLADSRANTTEHYHCQLIFRFSHSLGRLQTLTKASFHFLKGELALNWIERLAPTYINYVHARSSTIQLTTFSLPNSDSHSWITLCFPPRVSTTWPVCGFFRPSMRAFYDHPYLHLCRIYSGMKDPKSHTHRGQLLRTQP